MVRLSSLPASAAMPLLVRIPLLVLHVAERPIALGDPAAERVPGSAAGLVGVHDINTVVRIVGHAVLMPLSHWSHQRSISCRKPMRGSGTAKCGYLCAHGPMMALRGQRRPFISRGTALV